MRGRPWLIRLWSKTSFVIPMGGNGNFTTASGTEKFMTTKIKFLTGLLCMVCLCAFGQGNGYHGNFTGNGGINPAVAGQTGLTNLNTTNLTQNISTSGNITAGSFNGNVFNTNGGSTRPVNNVVLMGADPTGSNPSDKAFQAMISAWSTNGYPWYTPKGTYTITNAGLTFGNFSNYWYLFNGLSNTLPMEWFGDGTYGSGPGYGTVIHLTGASNTVTGAYLNFLAYGSMNMHDLTFKTDSNAIPIIWDTLTGLRLIHVAFQAGGQTFPLAVVGGGTSGVFTNYTTNDALWDLPEMKIRDCEFDGTGGITINSHGSVDIEDNTFWYGGGTYIAQININGNLSIHASQANIISGNLMYECTNLYGIVCTNMADGFVAANRVVDGTGQTAAVLLAAGTSNIMTFGNHTDLMPEVMNNGNNEVVNGYAGTHTIPFTLNVTGQANLSAGTSGNALNVGYLTMGGSGITNTNSGNNIILDPGGNNLWISHAGNTASVFIRSGNLFGSAYPSGAFVHAINGNVPGYFLADTAYAWPTNGGLMSAVGLPQGGELLLATTNGVLEVITPYQTNSVLTGGSINPFDGSALTNLNTTNLTQGVNTSQTVATASLIVTNNAAVSAGGSGTATIGNVQITGSRIVQTNTSQNLYLGGSGQQNNVHFQSSVNVESGNYFFIDGSGGSASGASSGKVLYTTSYQSCLLGQGGVGSESTNVLAANCLNTSTTAITNKLLYQNIQVGFTVAAGTIGFFNSLGSYAGGQSSVSETTSWTLQPGAYITNTAGTLTVNAVQAW
jgi:hypothetical protein